MADPRDDLRARNRFFVINAIRAAGVAMALVGLAILNHAITAPKWLGYVLLGFGLVDTFVAPVILARQFASRNLPDDRGDIS